MYLQIVVFINVNEGYFTIHTLWFSLCNVNTMLIFCLSKRFIVFLLNFQNSSDLVGLVQMMIMTFSEMPPVYAKPKNSTAQPPSVATPYPATPYPTQPGQCCNNYSNYSVCVIHILC